jgi:valyl-tRNA synthetase
MTNTLPKAYDYQNTEKRIYDMWEKSGFFKPSNDPQKPGFDSSIKPYVITIPPPNVTGILHLGHAMFVSMEDLMIRYHRMKGIPTLWVPGTDHAGIATQLKVENKLREQGTSREEIGREKFLEEAWEWKNHHHGVITSQIRRLGASCDWDRERFTLDEGLSEAVAEAFVRLYDKGLIYRGPYLVNWSPGLMTAVSDIEVEHSQEPGKLYYFKYPIKDSNEYLPVATTRPETILGDTAVCVHPEDGRYQHLIGKTALVPMLNREIPIIADEYVDREFGTGALKITPGHDINDYEIGLRHNLPIISIMDKKAAINEEGGQYAGLDRFDCRKKLWADMKAAGLVLKEEPYTLNVPRSQRGGEIVEPMISTQWFVKTKPLAEKALDAVKSGKIKIVPDFFEKIYFNWMENIQDWCISRQLWWGHRIPVWYGPDGTPFAAHNADEALEKAKEHYGEDVEINQEEDVLDTWFSSGLWPFSTLGWPEKTPDLNYFYPTVMMETGYDILFFWVSKMIMLGIEFMGEIPFSEIYLHGLIRDEKGRKMSKSLGNVIDPLIVMDDLGTDALRFTLLVGSSPGNDMNLSIDKVTANRNFANKIWNATRLVLSLIDRAPESANEKPDWTRADSWIWARSEQLRRDVERLFTTHQYGEAGRQIYDFFWSEFADWYLEIAKLQIAEGGDRAFYTMQNTVRILDICLRMLHPFTPFVTEELWGFLKKASMDKSSDLALFGEWEEMLMVAQFPEPSDEAVWENEAISDFNLVMEIVRSIRNMRAEMKVKPSLKIPATFVCGDQIKLIQNQISSISALSNLESEEIKIVNTIQEKPDGSVALVVNSIEIYLPLAKLVDSKDEKARLEKELNETESHISRLEKLLNSPFAEKAPANVVDVEKSKLENFKITAEKIKSQLEKL